MLQTLDCIWWYLLSCLKFLKLPANYECYSIYTDSWFDMLARALRCWSLATTLLTSAAWTHHGDIEKKGYIEVVRTCGMTSFYYFIKLFLFIYLFNRFDYSLTDGAGKRFQSTLTPGFIHSRCIRDGRWRKTMNSS